MTYISDVEIIKRCQQGDQDAFRELVNRYQEKVFWIAYQMVGNHEDCKDISQEAFLRVHRSIANFNLMSNFYTWLYRIVVNLCIDHFRKQKQCSKTISLEDTKEASSDMNSEPENIEKQEERQDVHRILQQIPTSYRTVLLLRDIEGFSCKEIVKILGCNSNTIRWRLFRARQMFKKLWKQNSK